MTSPIKLTFTLATKNITNVPTCASYNDGYT